MEKDYIKKSTQIKYKLENKIINIEIRYGKFEDAITYDFFDLDNNKKIGTGTYSTNPIETYYEEFDYYKTKFKNKDNYVQSTNYFKYDTKNISKQTLEEINVLSTEELEEFQLMQQLSEIVLYENKLYHHSIENIEIEEEYRNIGLGRLLINLIMKDIKNNFGGNIEDDIITLNASPTLDYKNGLEIENLVNFYKKNGFKTFFNQSKNQQMVIIPEKKDDIKIFIKNNNDKLINEIFNGLNVFKQTNEEEFFDSIEELEIYQVGGCIRDELMGKIPKDIDYVVKSTHSNMHEQMLRLGFKQVGADFPVYLHPKTNEEYALMRTERIKENIDNTNTINPYHNFEIITNKDITLEDDLSRRDLTINAIAKDSEGNYIDPFNGINDIKNKTLRHIKDEGFQEDPLRILRVARFAARYSDFTIADETLKLMKKMVKKGDINNLQPERIFLEIEKVLKDDNVPSIFFKTLDEIGALEIILPELYLLKGRKQNHKYHAEGDVFEHSLFVLDEASKYTNNPIIRFASLFHDIGKGFTDYELAKEFKYHQHDNIDMIIDLKNNSTDTSGLLNRNKTAYILLNNDTKITLENIIDNFQKQLKIPNEYIKLLKKSIQLHHLIHNFDNLSDKRIIKLFQEFRHKSDKEFFYQILEVAKYDSLGRYFLIDKKEYNINLYKKIKNAGNEIIVQLKEKVYSLKIENIKKYYNFFLSLNVKTMNIDTEKLKGKNGKEIKNIINQMLIQHFKKEKNPK